MRKWFNASRWLLVPVAVAVASAFAYFHTEWWCYRGLPRRWIEPMAGAQAAFFVALMVGWVAPRWKTLTVALIVIPGCWVGWKGAARFDPITQEPTTLPFFIPVAAAVLGLGLVAWMEWRQSRKPGT